jgi:putative ABC transport system substrate-binding protein
LRERFIAMKLPVKKSTASLLLIPIIIGCLFVYLRHTQQKKAAAYSIALFTPTTHPALEEIEQGFGETLQKLNSKSYTFTTFNANGNRTLLRAQGEEIVSGHYDLICTLGATCSQTVAELLSKKGIKTPHVFCGLESRELAQSLMATNTSSTGVYTEPNYAQEMDILHTLKPATKNILLVYDPTHGTGLEKYKQEIEEYIKKFGITLHSVEMYQTNEIQQKVEASLPQMDVVLVLIDNTVVAGIDALIALCNRYGVTLVVSDLASGKKGAALAYGITEYESGRGAAQKAYEILVQSKQPHELPLSAITKFQIEVNKNTMKTQKLDVDDAVIQQLQQEENNG